MMTLDEAIAHAREVAEDKRADADWKFRHGRLNADDCISCAEEHEQLAEWLEELKAYKSDDFTKNLQTLVYKQGYNKAIDDFVEKYKFCDNRSIQCRKGLNCADCIAEQLKVGGEND